MDASLPIVGAGHQRGENQRCRGTWPPFAREPREPAWYRCTSVARRSMSYRESHITVREVLLSLACSHARTSWADADTTAESRQSRPPVRSQMTPAAASAPPVTAGRCMWNRAKRLYFRKHPVGLSGAPGLMPTCCPTARSSAASESSCSSDLNCNSSLRASKSAGIGTGMHKSRTSRQGMGWGDNHPSRTRDTVVLLRPLPVRVNSSAGSDVLTKFPLKITWPMQ